MSPCSDLEQVRHEQDDASDTSEPDDDTSDHHSDEEQEIMAIGTTKQSNDKTKL